MLYHCDGLLCFLSPHAVLLCFICRTHLPLLPIRSFLSTSAIFNSLFRIPPCLIPPYGITFARCACHDGIHRSYKDINRKPGGCWAAFPRICAARGYPVAHPGSVLSAVCLLQEAGCHAISRVIFHSPVPRFIFPDKHHAPACIFLNGLPSLVIAVVD